MDNHFGKTAMKYLFSRRFSSLEVIFFIQLVINRIKLMFGYEKINESNK